MLLSTNLNRIDNTKWLYNEEEKIDDEFVVERPHLQSLKYLVVDVNRSPWEVIAVPLIFLSKETEFTFVFYHFYL